MGDPWSSDDSFKRQQIKNSAAFDKCVHIHTFWPIILRYFVHWCHIDLFLSHLWYFIGSHVDNRFVFRNDILTLCCTDRFGDDLMQFSDCQIGKCSANQISFTLTLSTSLTVRKVQLFASWWLDAQQFSNFFSWVEKKFVGRGGHPVLWIVVLNSEKSEKIFFPNLESLKWPG